MWAAASLNFALLEFLLEEKFWADLNHRDPSGKTALHYAASPFLDATFKDVGKCIQRLVCSGADPCGAGSHSVTPLMLTVSRDHAALDPHVSRTWGSDIHSRCFAALFDNGTVIHEKGARNGTILMSAILAGCPSDSIELICEHGALLNATNDDGLTALHLAVRNNAPKDVVSTLLRRGADPNVLSSERNPRRSTLNGYTPLADAFRIEVNDEIIETLLKHGADPDLNRDTTMTPREMARMRLYDRSHLLVPPDQPPERTDKTDTTTESSNQSWFQRRISALPVPIFRTNSKPA